jgi:hypothetical protein
MDRHAEVVELWWAQRVPERVEDSERWTPGSITRASLVASEGIWYWAEGVRQFSAFWTGAMQDSACGIPRGLLLGTRVNKECSLLIGVPRP